MKKYIIDWLMRLKYDWINLYLAFKFVINQRGCILIRDPITHKVYKHATIADFLAAMNRLHLLEWSGIIIYDDKYYEYDFKTRQFKKVKQYKEYADD